MGDFPGEVSQQSRAAGGERMTNGDRTAFAVESRQVAAGSANLSLNSRQVERQFQIPQTGQVLRGKGFIDFKSIDVSPLAVRSL